MIRLDNATVYHGSNLDILPTLPDNSVDSIVTDPPYELGFMGKKWDSSGIAYSVELWQQCLRVLKPGGHLLAFGGSRTWHRLAVAIEDAGFEVRDSIAWLYGSGFPKSMDVSKSIEAKLVTGSSNKQAFKNLNGKTEERTDRGGLSKKHSDNDRPSDYTETAQGDYLRTLEPTTDEAKKWAGWGTALKPAFEPVVVARKPLVGTVAANVLEWGVGGLNIDGSRIGTETISVHNAPTGSFAGGDADRGSDTSTYREHTGRWPANIILDEYTARLLDEQSGISKSPASYVRTVATNSNIEFNPKLAGTEQLGFGDSGGASRFFYVAKASKKDRNEGLDGLEPQRHSDRENAEGVGGDNPRNRTNEAKQNFHPTVKPTALMEYLIRLVTPAGGVVLDPFTGSGSTGKAALLNGYRFIGCELTEEYLPIIEGRLKHAAEQYSAKATEEETKEQETLF